MHENLYQRIQDQIDFLRQHAQQSCQFSLKKNDHLLQKIFSDIILFSEKKMSSDIHVEPQENVIRIRLRIDGVLYEKFQLPKIVHEQLCSKIKILANLNIAQVRIPQDGKFFFESEHASKIHIRISTCPTIHGEKIVLRLLDEKKISLTLDALGMSGVQLNIFRESIAHPSGLILVTGPTGSGKTTTL